MKLNTRCISPSRVIGGVLQARTLVNYSTTASTYFSKVFVQDNDQAASKPPVLHNSVEGPCQGTILLHKQVYGYLSFSKTDPVSIMIVKDLLLKMLKEDMNLNCTKSNNDTTIISEEDNDCDYIFKFAKTFFALIISMKSYDLITFIEILNKELSAYKHDALFEDIINTILNVDTDIHIIKDNVLQFWLISHLLDSDTEFHQSLKDFISKENMYKMDEYLESLKNINDNVTSVDEIKTKDILKVMFKETNVSRFKELVDKVTSIVSEYTKLLEDTENEHIQRSRNHFSENRKFLTNFLVDFCGILIEYKPVRLMNILEMLDAELTNYKYEGCKFGEMFDSYADRRHIYNSFLSDMGTTPESVNAALHFIKHKFEIEDENFKRLNMVKFVTYLDNTYNETHVKVFKDMVESLNRYRTEDFDVQPEIRKFLRAALFDHVSAMKKNDREELGNQLNSHEEGKTKGFIGDTYNESVEYYLVDAINAILFEK